MSALFLEWGTLFLLDILFIGRWGIRFLEWSTKFTWSTRFPEKRIWYWEAGLSIRDKGPPFGKPSHLDPGHHFEIPAMTDSTGFWRFGARVQNRKTLLESFNIS